MRSNLVGGHHPSHEVVREGVGHLDGGKAARRREPVVDQEPPVDLRRHAVVARLEEVLALVADALDERQDALPDEPPAQYAMAHARILRWAAAVAEAGDDYAAAVLELDDERLRLASRKMADTVDLYVLAAEAAAEAVRRLRT